MADQDGLWPSVLSKLHEVFYVVLVLVGIAIVILACTKGVTSPTVSLPVNDPVSRYLLAAFGIAVMVLGLVVKRTTASTESLPKWKDYGIKILSPGPGSTVGRVDVRGVIKKPLPPGFRLWVFRVYNDLTYYPLRECSIDENMNWVAKDCDPGGKTGEERAFSVNLVGQDGAALISFVQEAVQRYSPIREELVNRTGKTDVPFLPPARGRTRDIMECDKVGVKRA